MDTLIGILLVTLAGLGTGTIAWPMKLMRTLSFEHYWFLAMLVSLVIFPWAVVALLRAEALGSLCAKSAGGRSCCATCSPSVGESPTCSTASACCGSARR